jgi:hypothetical protein
MDRGYSDVVVGRIDMFVCAIGGNCRKFHAA